MFRIDPRAQARPQPAPSTFPKTKRIIPPARYANAHAEAMRRIQEDARRAENASREQSAAPSPPHSDAASSDSESDSDSEDEARDASFITKPAYVSLFFGWFGATAKQSIPADIHFEFVDDDPSKLPHRKSYSPQALWKAQMAREQEAENSKKPTHTARKSFPLTPEPDRNSSRRPDPPMSDTSPAPPLPSMTRDASGSGLRQAAPPPPRGKRLFKTTSLNREEMKEQLFRERSERNRRLQEAERLRAQEDARRQAGRSQAEREEDARRRTERDEARQHAQREEDAPRRAEREAEDERHRAAQLAEELRAEAAAERRRRDAEIQWIRAQRQRAAAAEEQRAAAAQRQRDADNLRARRAAEDEQRERQREADNLRARRVEEDMRQRRAEDERQQRAKNDERQREFRAEAERRTENERRRKLEEQMRNLRENVERSKAERAREEQAGRAPPPPRAEHPSWSWSPPPPRREEHPSWSWSPPGARPAPNSGARARAEEDAAEARRRAQRLRREESAFKRMAGRWDARERHRGSSSPSSTPLKRTLTPTAHLTPRERYEVLWTRLLSPPTGDTRPFTFASFPWPGGRTLVEIAKFLLSGVEGGKEKYVIRQQLKRWHPDKFAAVAQGRVVEADRQRVLEGQVAVVLALNELLGRF